MTWLLLLPVLLWADPFEAPVPAPAPTERIEPSSRGGRPAGTFVVTSYCLEGVMRDGEWVHPGAVAVDPSIIALGTDLYIEGLEGRLTSHDTGSAVIGRHVDLWLSDCDDSINWGVQRRRVSLVEGSE